MNDGVLVLIGGGLFAAFVFLYMKYWKILNEEIPDFFARDKKHWKKDIKQMSPGVKLWCILCCIFWAIGWFVVGLLALGFVVWMAKLLFSSKER